MEKLLDKLLGRYLNCITIEKVSTKRFCSGGKDYYLRAGLKKTIEAKTPKDVKEMARKLSLLNKEILEEEVQNL